MRSVLIDHADRGRAIVQDFPKLTLLLDDLRLVLGERRNVVHPQDPLAAGKADMAAVIRHLHVGQQQMDRRGRSWFAR